MIPQRTSAASCRIPEVFITRISVTRVSRAEKARKWSRNRKGTSRGTIRRAGMPAARGSEAATPAEAGERPLDSRILGS